MTSSGAPSTQGSPQARGSTANPKSDFCSPPSKASAPSGSVVLPCSLESTLRERAEVNEGLTSQGSLLSKAWAPQPGIEPRPPEVDAHRTPGNLLLCPVFLVSREGSKAGVTHTRSVRGARRLQRSRGLRLRRWLATGALRATPGLPVPLGCCGAVPEAPLEPSCPEQRLGRRRRRSPAPRSRGGLLPGPAAPRRPIPASVPVGSQQPLSSFGRRT